MTGDDQNTAQTNTDAVDGDVSATEASTDNSQTHDEGAKGQSQDSQSAAEGKEGGKQATEDDQKTGDDQDKDEKEGEGYHGAPEAYTDFTLPEGMPVDEQILGLSHEVFKELDLSQAGAQRLVDLQLQVREAEFKTLIENHQQQQQDWIKEIKADPELGGTKFERSTATARRPVEQFGDDEFRALLEPFDPETNPTGLGLANNPAFNRVFYRIGSAISEDNPGSGSPNAQNQELSTEEWIKESFDSSK